MRNSRSASDKVAERATLQELTVIAQEFAIVLECLDESMARARSEIARIDFLAFPQTVSQSSISGSHVAGHGWTDFGERVKHIGLLPEIREVKHLRPWTGFS
jgi:hypothetical protein